MSKKLNLILMFFVVLSLPCGDAFSELTHARNISISSRDAMSAWTRPKGRIYNQLYYSYHESENKFTSIERDANGNFVSADGEVEKVETDKFTANTITYHGEYGITDTLTVFTHIPWIYARYDEIIQYSDDDSINGIGDIDLGLRYNLARDLFNSQTLMSVQGSVKIPEAYDHDNPLTNVNLGDGQYDVSMDVLLGREWDKSYVMFNAGYTYRFENEEHDPYNFKPSDQIRVLLGGAYAIVPRLYLKGTIDWRKSTGNASVSHEMKILNLAYGGSRREDDKVLVKDTLGLEQDILNLGIALSYDISNRVQATLQYNTDIKGADDFGTRDAAQVSTYSALLVLKF